MIKKFIQSILSIFIIFLLSGCNTVTSSVEQSSDFSNEIAAVIDKSPAISSGNLITKTATDSDGKLHIRYYDKNNNIVEEYVWDDDIIFSHTIMNYADSGVLLSKEIISEDGQANIGYFYTYDERNELLNTTEYNYSKGMLTKSKKYDTFNNILECINYTYNNNQLIRVDYYAGEDTLTKYAVYEYSESNQIVKYSIYDSNDNLLQFSTSEYDATGKLYCSKNFDSNRELQNYTITEYYDTGETKSVTKYDTDGNIISTELY